MPTKDIDTDQIIPARFLTTTTREGLGKFVFNDLRCNDDGSDNDEFVLNQPASKGCEILVGGKNFGCGSSREHAPWALLDYGFKAVISTEIADIFRSNSLKNGLIPVVINEDAHQKLRANPGIEVTIDLDTCTLIMPGEAPLIFPIDSFARHCLMQGIDQLGYLQQHAATIKSYEENRSWMP